MTERILSPSEINCFRDCRQKWYFGYVERRRIPTTGKARIIGLIVHNGLAAWYAKESIEDCYAALQAAANKYDAPKEQRDIARGVFEHYIIYYATDLDLYEPLIIETKITEAAIGLKCIPDLVVLEKATGKYYIFDHKVVSDLAVDKTFDTQKIALFKVLSERYPLSGIVFNMIRSKLPIVPEPVKKNDRLKKFTPSSTTEAIFKKALSMYGFKAVDYKEATDFFKNNPNQFFSRVPVDITQEELEDFERNQQIVRDGIASGVIYMNRQWDCKRNCDYYADCFTLMDDEPENVLASDFKTKK
jgi:hypothetical protein